MIVMKVIDKREKKQANDWQVGDVVCFWEYECLLHYLEAYEGELKDIEPAKETCEYCTFDGDHGKSFMFQLGFSNEEMVICKHHGHYYISCTTNDISDKINGIQERNSKDINFCPNCGRRLK